MRRWAGVAFAALVLVASGLASGHGDAVGASASLASAAPADFAAGSTANHFTWSTTVAGNFALRLHFNVPGTQTCTFIVKAAGSIGTSTTLSYFGHDRIARTWTSLQAPHPLSVHASGAAVVLGPQVGPLWAATHTHIATLQGQETWMYAGFGLQGWNNPVTNGKSLVLDLRCPSAFTVVALEGGKQLLAFTPAWLRGGVGATTSAPLATGVNVLDSAARTFTEPDVHLRLRAEDTFASGAMLVQKPSGNSQHALLGDDEVFLDGPSGSWGVTLTRASIGPQQAVGLIAGMRPVPSLDAAAAI